jgi:hypothetical protein
VRQLANIVSLPDDAATRGLRINRGARRLAGCDQPYRGLAVKIRKIEAIFAHMFVHRAGVGAAPFTWELHGDGLRPIHVSGDRFKSMNAAHEAGQARLAALIRSAGSCLLPGTAIVEQ